MRLNDVYVNFQECLYLHCVGKGMVYLRRRVDSGKLYRYTAGHENSGYRLETFSYPTIVMRAGRRRRAMCCVCLTEKRSVNSVNYTVRN